MKKKFLLLFGLLLLAGCSGNMNDSSNSNSNESVAPSISHSNSQNSGIINTPEDGSFNSVPSRNIVMP